MSGIAMKNKLFTSSLPNFSPSETVPVIHVFGHRNPDSDSICSALVVADWLNPRLLGHARFHWLA